MNNFKLRQRKMPTILKLGVFALFGACMCVPCLKYQDVDKKVFIPPILNNINYRVADDADINGGIIVNSISYNSSTGYYRCDYAVPIYVLEPYQAYANMYFTFEYVNDNQVNIVQNYFNYVDTSIETFGTSQSFSGSYYYLIGNYYSSQSDYVFRLTGQGNGTFTFVNNETLDGTDYALLTPSVAPGKTQGIHVYPLRLVDDATRSYRQGYDDGTQYGIGYVLEHLSEYNLYTQQEYLAYGASEYQRGFNASNDVLSIAGFVHEIFKSPVTMFKEIFNWSMPLPNGEVINMLPLMTFLLTIGIALAVVNLILKIK